MAGVKLLSNCVILNSKIVASISLPLIVDPGFCHHVRYVLLERVHTIGHFIDSAYYLVRHGLEALLGIPQNALDLKMGKND